MVENQSAAAKRDGQGQYRLQLAGHKPGDERPTILVTAVDLKSQVLHVAEVDAQGYFDMPDEALKGARLILVGPGGENQEAIDPNTLLRYRPRQFEQIIREGTLNIPARIWQQWFFFLECVTGTVSLCRRRPWWFSELAVAATAPAFETVHVNTARKLSLSARISPQTTLTKSLPELINWPTRCQVVCNGVVEVYRRTCCCEPWIINDPRLPDLIRELEDLLRHIPPVVPIPNPPDPPPFVEKQFFKEGALDEKAINAHRDLSAIRSLYKTAAIDYINARPYLFCHRSCGTPKKVAEGFINPDGRFTICWFDSARVHPVRCHDEFAYIVKQTIGGSTFTIYNGVAANIWFNQSDDASLVSYSPFAFGCRDNGEPGTGAFAYLDVIGDTESWHLKTPDATAWDRVAAPGYNDGTVFPAATPADATGQNLNRNWGGTLKLNYMFSEDMQTTPIHAKYYRISITEADGSGNPVGARHYLSAGLSWNKTVWTGTSIDVVPVVLGPFSQGGQDNLFLIPFDNDEFGNHIDWNADQYHGFLNTALYVDPDHPEKRHLLTLEVFDATGQLLHPTGTAPTGQPGLTEVAAGFTFRRRFQDLGPTAEVHFAALTHMFWWDNQDLQIEIVELRLDSSPFNEECLFLEGDADSTFSISYRAYHPTEMFQLSHSISWQRGLHGASGYLLASASDNVGEPPAAPGISPTNTFGEMLGDNSKCSFTVFLSISGKTTDGDNLGNPSKSISAAFALEV